MFLWARVLYKYKYCLFRWPLTLVEFEKTKSEIKPFIHPSSIFFFYVLDLVLLDMKSPSGILKKCMGGGGETQSTAATAVPSTAGSILEKPSLEDVGQLQSRVSGDTKAVNGDGQTQENDNTEENNEENMEYPTGFPLVIIVVGLCLAVLLVALVRLIYSCLFVSFIPLSAHSF